DNPHPDNTENSDGSLAWVAWPWFTVGLKMRGFSDEDVAKIVGGNILRVLGDVQTAATGL
ncbi:MAG: membrane dipeptidase, partial [Armatimonadetes bacterium]|nr:membrane dipeptidase [Armatimonadota bacterium]